MIITCPNCNKKFQIDAALVPDNGRDLQCGACKHVWFYKKENENSSPLTLNKDLVDNEIKDNLPKKEIENITDNNKLNFQEKPKNKEKKIKDTSDNKKIKTNKETTGGKFFSYLIVLIISFVALIILVDTLKTPIINVFPGVEIILFNLFETLQDIKLFIIDLS
jgi:predicted Zn finger-like uncharacterized protein